jgi:hypothetical protein
MKASARIQHIEKETVSNLKFPPTEVLRGKESIDKRLRDIEQAMKLGNLEKGKIRIIFEDSEGYKQVETTVWGVTDKRIILKQNMVIPINRVHEIHI